MAESKTAKKSRGTIIKQTGRLCSQCKSEMQMVLYKGFGPRGFSWTCSTHGRMK